MSSSFSYQVLSLASTHCQRLHQYSTRLLLSLSMANIWLSKVRNDPHLQRTEAQTAITTVHNLALDIITPSNAAETISTAYVPAVQTEHISLWSLWETIISAIETLGSDTDVLRRLALMLMHLSTIQAVTENGNMLESQGGQKVWQELPDFSFQFWEVGIRKFIGMSYIAPTGFLITL